MAIPSQARRDTSRKATRGRMGLAKKTNSAALYRGVKRADRPLYILIKHLTGKDLSLDRCRVFVGGIMRRSKTLRARIERRIARKRGEDVFLTREFRDLGGEDQVLRVLRILVREKRLVRLGYGVYGRAVVSRLSGDPILYSQNGFLGAARQALTKLGVTWEPSEAERDYNEGRSTQIPLNPVVKVKGRFSRRLRDGKQELVLAR